MPNKAIDMHPNTVLSIIAPTASGKTALAYDLYDKGSFELISVDSALIYQDMNIGTAKPTQQELLSYPHHLVDIISPTESYSVANFVTDVQELIKEIQQRGHIPVLVGGTMMYYMALFDGISPVPNTQADIRQQVEAWRRSEGIADLYAYLTEHDPKTAERLHLSDTQRITRAVEVHKQTAVPISKWQQLPKKALAKQDNNHWQVLSIMPDRDWLHQRIAQRLDIMWANGFIEEVIGLIKQYPLSTNLSSMRCVGYRQVIDFLLQDNLAYLNNNVLKLNINSNITNTEDMTGYLSNYHKETCQAMKNKALYATRQLAKRQYTWLRKLNKLNSNQLDNNGGSDSKNNNRSIEINVFNHIKEVELWLDSS